MFSDFSKPSGDIATESLRYTQDGQETLQRQQQLARILQTAPAREQCLLCHDAFGESEQFKHRDVDYWLCHNCGHIQTVALPPPGYPHQQGDGLPFDTIYPELSKQDYISRRDRIYRPKLDWILRRLGDSGLSKERILASRWLELGTGAGYFLHALQEQGIQQFSGLDDNQALVDIANKMLGDNRVHVHKDSIAQAVSNLDADIYVAFFVLEHVENNYTVWKSLAEKPSGTLFIFSVPTFGFSTLLESAFEQHVARNLDNVVHTQLFTDKSIRYGLDLANFELLAEWVFGQDAIDLSRLITRQISTIYPETLLNQVSMQLVEMQDSLQSVIDQAYMADARHLIAIKR